MTNSEHFMLLVVFYHTVGQVLGGLITMLGKVLT